jgi:hypothetical protein
MIWVCCCATGARSAGKTKELLAALLAYPNVKTEWKSPKAVGSMPVRRDMPIISR